MYDCCCANGRNLPFASLLSKPSVRLQHLSRPSMQHPETITRGKRGLGRLGILHRAGDGGKVRTEGFCVGTVTPSCLQVCVAVPSRWSSRHRVCLGLNDEGIKDESNHGPPPCVLWFPYVLPLVCSFTANLVLSAVPYVAGQR